MRKLPAHRCRRRPGYFRPVPVRARRDGWTVRRQCAFLAELYFTGSVAAAARAVGMTRESAHRLRVRPGAESFAAAWDRVLAQPGAGRIDEPQVDHRKITDCDLAARMERGFVKPVIYRGRMTAIKERADNTTLLRLARRSDARVRRLLQTGFDGAEGVF